MIKAEKFQEQVEGILKDRQDFEKRKINKDIKLVEDELEDLYERIERARESNGEIPKYAEVNKILEKPVADDLILNQGFFLDITNNKHTRIYYNKNDFENRVKNDNTSLNDKQKEFCNERKIDINKLYKRLAEIYQDKEYGVNIIMEANSNGYYQLPEYLESRGIVDRYISILNKIKRGEYNV